MRLHSARWAIAAGLAAAAFGAFQSRHEVRNWIQNRQFRIEGLEAARPSEVYFLQTDSWLEFDTPDQGPLAKIVSNASISSGDHASPDKKFPYAIEYQLTRADGTVLASGAYCFKTQLVLFADRKSGRPVEVNSYFDRARRPLGSRNCSIRLKEPGREETRKLRLRLQSKAPELLDVAVRVYFRLDIPERKVAYLWNRMNEEQRRDLARGNVYSFRGVSDREKAALLRYRWSVAAPNGIPGKDFARRRLYVRDETTSLQVLREWIPTGIFVDADHPGILPLSNSAVTCELRIADPSKFQLTALAGEVEAPGARGTNTLVVTRDALPGTRDSQPSQVLATTFPWPATQVATVVSTQQTLLRIEASKPTFIRAFQREAEGSAEITPDPVHLLAFVCAPTNSVDYLIENAGNDPTLFRLEARRGALSASHRLPSTVMHYAILAEDHKPLETGSILLTNQFSVYDWLVTDAGLTNVTDPQPFCFVLPPGGRTLRVSAPAGTIFVTAYSRPGQLPRRVRIPEDYSPERLLFPTEPAWFAVRPPDQFERRMAGHTATLRVQPRPAQIDPLILAGQYEWESFLPKDDPRGRIVLVPRPADSSLRAESAPFTYFPVHVGVNQTVRFQAGPFDPFVDPTLILVFPDKPGLVKVTVNDDTLFDNRLETPVAEVRLGKLKPGEHQLNIFSEQPVKAYVNLAETGAGDALIKRFCFAATTNRLSIPYVKASAAEELLVARVFSPSDEGTPFQVSVRLRASHPRGIGPYGNVTLLERIAQVTPGKTLGGSLVGSAVPGVDDGQPMFIPIGPDLPPGAYELEVMVTSSSPRWLTVSRTTPGAAEKLSVTLEPRVY